MKSETIINGHKASSKWERFKAGVFSKLVLRVIDLIATFLVGSVLYGIKKLFEWAFASIR